MSRLEGRSYEIGKSSPSMSYTTNETPEEWWKPTPKNRVRELVKAGALIAAEIDRLQRDKP